MHVIKNQLTAFYDVDETLITLTYLAGDAEAVEGALVLDWYGKVQITPRQEYVDSVKAHKAEGHNVVIWSGSGSEWAKMVIEKLGLEKYVDVVMPKPDVFYDDLRPEDFMRNKIYVDSTNVTSPMDYVQAELDNDDSD